MTRWHSPDCGQPNIVVKSAIPFCQTCKRSPDLDALVAEQSHISSVPSMPPDEPLDKLRLSWPSTVNYTPCKASVGESGPAAAMTPEVATPEKEKSSVVYSEALDEAQFRLLCVHPSPDREAPIHADLEIYAFDACPEYEAVPYTWGGETDDTTKCMPVYIGPFWDVVLQTRNCAAMLRYARRLRSIRMLWIDAFCINQLNTVEKALQIPRMSTIFRDCERVIAYLGEELVGQTSSDLSPRRSFEAFFEDEKGFVRPPVSFTDCRYLTRVWVIQELVLARQVVLPFLGVEYWADRAIIRRVRWHETGKESMPQWFQEHLAQQSFRSDDISDALEKTWKSSSTDIRDKVFAVLGLMGNLSAGRLTPDYTVSALHMFIGLSAHLIFNMEARDSVLGNAIGIKGWGKQPSWVPDWSATGCWPLRELKNAIYPENDELMLWGSFNGFSNFYHSNFPLGYPSNISIDGIGALSLCIFYICPIRNPLENTGVSKYSTDPEETETGFESDDLYEYQIPFGDEWILSILPCEDDLDILVDTQRDHLLWIEATPWLARNTGIADDEYRLVVPLHTAFLKPKDPVRVDDDPTHLTDFLIANSLYALYEEPPFMTPDGVISDPSLERVFPELYRRRKTTAAKIFMRQVFPGARHELDILHAFSEQQRRVDFDHWGNLSGEMIFTSVTMLKQAFRTVNVTFQPKYHGVEGSGFDHHFVTLYWPPSLFTDFQAFYLNPQTTTESKVEEQEQDEDAPQPLTWEWSVDENSNDSYEKIDPSDPEAMRRCRGAIIGERGVSLRARVSDVLSRLLYYRWDLEVLKHMGGVCGGFGE